MPTDYNRDNNAVLNSKYTPAHAINSGDILADYFEFCQNIDANAGMGKVMLCKDKRNGLYYAVKTFKSGAVNRDLFLKEAAFCLTLNPHPNTVNTVTVFDDGNYIFLLMEFIGRTPQNPSDKAVPYTLDKFFKKLNTQTALKYAVEICRGMEYLSSVNGFISHNDIKPQNIFITQEGHAKIGDFGLQSLKTGKGGTLGYRPPEFFTNKPHDIRSDIYSFGIVLYQMFNAGAFPFKDNTFPKQNRQGHKLLDGKKIRQSYCGGIINKCLRQKPENRYQNFTDLAAALSPLCKTVQQPAAMPVRTAEDYFYKARGFYILGDYKKALPLFDRAIKIYKRFSEAYNGRGSTMEHLGRYKQAFKDYSKAIKYNPDFDAAYNNRGDLKRKFKLYDEALKDLNTAIKLNKDNAIYYNNRGTLKDDLGLYKQAVKDYKKAIKLSRGYLSPVFNCGNTKYRMGLYRSALIYFNRAIKLNPAYAYAYNNRALTYQKLNKPHKALKDMKTVLKLHPSHKNAAAFIKKHQK